MAKDDDARRDDVEPDDPARDDGAHDDGAHDDQLFDEQADDERAYDDEAEHLTEEPVGAGSGDVSRTALVGGVVGVVLLVVVASFLVWTFLNRDDGAADADRAGIAEAAQTLSTSSPASAGAAPSEAPAASATPHERCLVAAGALEETLTAAGPALDRWGVHVGAMNQLVVGEITLQQATAFWERTRLGALRTVGDFRTARKALGRAGVDCPRPGLLGPAGAGLRPCARHVDALVRVLRVARTSIETWSTHVHHMDMLRLGTLSPEEATEMWLSMWQQGVRDLDAYQAAAASVQQSQGCRQLG